jgi:FkbM family methyltransferase
MPRNLEMLRHHIELNGLRNVTVVAAAAYDKNGTIQMAEGSSPSEFHTDPSGGCSVRSIALDAWQAETGAALPRVMKIDVEGAESALLRGAARILKTARPVIYLALHGEQQRHECGAVLIELGFKISALDGRPVSDSSEWLAEPA